MRGANYQALKDELIRSGDTNFRSDTDTEVLAHLIGKLYYDSCASTADLAGKKARLFEAARTALRQVIGGCPCLVDGLLRAQQAAQADVNGDWNQRPRAWRLAP